MLRWSHPSMEVSNAQRQRSDRTGPNVRRTRRTGYRPDFAAALQGNGGPLPISVSRASGSNAPTRTRAVALIRPIRTGRPKVVPDQNDIPSAADAASPGKEIHEARAIRDAEQRDPGIVRR